MRLFLALPLPQELRRDLRRLQQRLAPQLPGWRWLRAEGIHLTLRFLGEVDHELERRCRPRWERAAAATPALRLRTAALDTFPSRKRPRVLVQQVDGPGDVSMRRLAAGLEQQARAAGFAAQRRTFRPHLTLARARREDRPAGLPADLVPPTPLDFEVTCLELMRSRLLPDGARYTVVTSFPLARAS